MLIGINGALKSGKDTTYQIIKELYPHAERISFAAKLKDSAAAALNLSVAELEKLKNEEEVFIALVMPADEYFEELFSQMDGWRLTLREYLQNYGTEAHRDVFGTDFWVDQALPLDTDHSDRLLVVTDMRFPNEVERVKALDGITWKIMRETETNFGNHPSEQNLGDYIDLYIDNTGSLDELREKVRTAMNRLLVPTL
jgi:hypothetical protein